MININGLPLRLRALPPMPLLNGINDVSGSVKFCIGVNLTVGDFKDWSPQRLANFFNGVAQVIRARGIPQ